MYARFNPTDLLSRMTAIFRDNPLDVVYVNCFRYRISLIRNGRNSRVINKGQRNDISIGKLGTTSS